MSVPTPILQYNLSDATIKGLLPAGYTPLAYIESTGTLWIDSDVALNGTTSTYIFSCRVGASTRDGHNHSFFGTDYYHTGMMGIYHYSTNNNYYAFYIQGLSKPPTNYVIPKGNMFDFYLKMDLSNNTYESKIDKDTLRSGSFNTMSDTTTTIKIFKTVEYPGGYWKCYYFRIAKDNVLQIDLIPARRDSDRVIGMYDLVSRTFKTNSGSGTFIAGPELAVGKGGGKSLPEEYLLVEYLQMDPGLYINTGQAIAVDDVTKTEAWMWYADGNTRDLMGWSLSAAEYWGCTANSTWEKAAGVSPITQRQKVVYDYTAAVAGTYQIGAVSGNHSTRTKYIELVKITIGGSLKRNLYACYRKSDMKPGMYDTVNGVFYTNAGSGEFILGPSITNTYTYEPINGKNLWKKSSTWNATNSTLSRLNNLGFNGIPGPWTISFDAYASLNTSASIDICDLGSKTISLTITPQHYFITATAKNYYTVENENGFFDIAGFGNGVTVYLSNITMYNSDIDLGYRPSNVNGLYINCNSIYDTSKGWVADFTDNTAHLSATIPAVGNNFSVAWWELSSNFNANATMPWTIYPFNPLFNKYLNTADGLSNPWYKLGTTTIIDDIPNNGWHHFVVTGNGSVNYLYVDGIKYGLSKTFKGLTGTSLVMNGLTLTTSYCRNPKISNFQIFNVALTDEQVKELYGE